MNTKELIKVVHEETGLTYRESERAVRSVIGQVKEAVAGGDEVNLKGLLNIKRVHRNARVYKSGMTGSTVTKPAHTRPVISLSGPLVKEATRELNG